MRRRRQQEKEPLKDKSHNIDSVPRPLPQLPVAPKGEGGHPHFGALPWPRPRKAERRLARVAPEADPAVFHRNIAVPAPLSTRMLERESRGRWCGRGDVKPSKAAAGSIGTSHPTTVPAARGCLGTPGMGTHGTAPELPDAVGRTTGMGIWECSPSSASMAQAGEPAGPRIPGPPQVGTAPAPISSFQKLEGSRGEWVGRGGDCQEKKNRLPMFLGRTAAGSG